MSSQRGDRISLLPEEILHEILSLLPTKDATRTSVLSKQWRKVWTSFPVLNLDSYQFRDFADAKEEFVSCVDRSLSDPNRTCLEKLSLRAEFDPELAPHLDRWMNLAMEKNVQDLDLDLDVIDTFYDLPETIFPSRSTFTGLSLCGCRFQIFNFTSCLFLKHVSLTMVHVMDELLMNLISSCPLLESFYMEECHEIVFLKVFSRNLRSMMVENCDKIEKVQMDVPKMKLLEYYSDNFDIPEMNPFGVNGLCSLETLSVASENITNNAFLRLISSCPNLLKLNLQGCRDVVSIPGVNPKLISLEVESCPAITRVEIDASKLEYFVYSGSFRACILNPPGTCRFSALKMLSLVCVNISDESFEGLIFGSSLLESLHLERCNTIRNLKIYNRRVENLHIANCFYLVGIHIDAPNLQSFLYRGNILKFSMVNSSCELDAELHLRPFYPDNLYGLVNIWNPCQKFEGHIRSHHLKDLFQRFGHARCLTLVTRSFRNLIIPGKLFENSQAPLYNVKQLRLKTVVTTMCYTHFLFSILKVAPRLETLSMKFLFTTVDLEFLESNVDNDNNDMNSQVNPYDFVRNRVKEITIESRGDDGEMLLVQFFLENAMMLEKMFITFSKKNNFGMPLDDEEMLRRRSIIQNWKTDRFKRASPHAEVEVFLPGEGSEII